MPTPAESPATGSKPAAPPSKSSSKPKSDARRPADPSSAPPNPGPTSRSARTRNSQPPAQPPAPADDASNAPPSGAVPTASSCISEGDLLLKRGEFRRAADAYSLALQLRPDDKPALCSRARAYLLMGLPKKTLEDADAALSLLGIPDSDPPASPEGRAPRTAASAESQGGSALPLRAMHLKAEALYALGRFEDALAWFHRGRRRCPPGGDGEFRTGIGKAEEAIRNALALDGGRRTGGAGKAAPKAGKGGEADAAVLGPLAQDLAYLRAMRADPLLEGMDAVKALAGEGVEYLENRAAFWRSQKGLDRGTQGRADGEEPGKGRIGAADATARTKK